MFTTQTGNIFTGTMGGAAGNVWFQYTQPPPRTVHLRVALPQETDAHRAQMTDFIQRMQAYFSAGCAGLCPEPSPLEHFMENAGDIIEGEIVRDHTPSVTAIVPADVAAPSTPPEQPEATP